MIQPKEEIIQSKYDVALSQIGDYKSDVLKQAFHEMAWVESKGIVDRKQNDDPDAYAKGLGLGKYQYDADSAKTALTRFKNLVSSGKTIAWATFGFVTIN